MKTQTLVVEKIVAGGMGVGRLEDGMVVLLPHVLPGETVLFRTMRRKARYLEGEVVAVIDPSAGRRLPPCPVFGRCGGCDLQHGNYDAQLRIKRAILGDLLLRGGIAATEEFPLAITAAPAEFGYRQRLRLQIDKQGRLGFYRSHSHEVVTVAECPLAAPAINSVVQSLCREQPAIRLLQNASAIEVLFSPADGDVVLLLHFDRPPRPADRKAAAALCDRLPDLRGVVFAAPGQAMGPVITGAIGAAGSGDPHDVLIRFTVAAGKSGETLLLTVEPGGFSQVNTAQNDAMIRILLAWLPPGDSGRVLDLFCGMGNLSLPVSRQAKEVVGMDLQGAAIRSARRNATANRIDNCRFEKLGAAQGARRLVEQGERFELVLLDPPRAGCREVVEWLPRLGAERLVYISCDPATLVRDLGLLNRQGYGIERMQLVDMFPQTHHLETMTLLRRDA